MAIEILRDLRGLRVEVMHPPDVERARLIEHLARIGCLPFAVWPFPSDLSPEADLVVVAIEHDSRDVLRHLFRDNNRLRATVIGIVGYENPSTLQLVLEIGAQAVIERPIRPFGLLTQLVIARSLWQIQHEAQRQAVKLKPQALRREHHPARSAHIDGGAEIDRRRGLSIHPPPGHGAPSADRRCRRHYRGRAHLISTRATFQGRY